MSATKKSRKKLKRVIAVRHGTDSGTNLDDNGREQVRRLASAIREKFVRARQVVQIFSSTFPRAVQSAEIIAQELGYEYTLLPVLEGDNFLDGEAMMEELLKARNGSDVLIAVTHYDAPSGIISALSKKFFQRTSSNLISENGDGCTLCMKTGVAMKTLLA